jgi:pimeloyl-ACP methyl ester carboxylesterase
MSGQVVPGSAGTLIFSHANGFPAGCYRQMLEPVRAAGWQVLALPKFGHDPRFPVTNNWPHLRDELLAFVAAEVAPTQRLTLMGHSMGGYVSLLAATRLKARLQGVLLLDSPVVAGWRAHSWHVAKLSGLAARLSPGHISARRRWQWPSAAAAHGHFATKRAFARWASGVLADYIDCGTEPDPAQPGGVRLAFVREVETRIYNTLPHHLESLLQRHPLRVPVGFIGGTQSVEIRQAGLAYTRRLCGVHLAWLEAGHLFPMEQPQLAAQAALKMLAEMSPAGPTATK